MFIRSLLTLLLLTPIPCVASNLKITVSSEPLANMVRMITENSAEVETIANSSSCPHEYILKPSDFKRAQNSDFVVYLSDYFEPFIDPIVKNSPAKVINLSESLKINPKNNMHIWMSLENVRKIVIMLSDKLHKPNITPLRQIDDLIRYKKTQLAPLTSVLLLSDSLEYLFEDMPHVKIEKLYIIPGMTSAKDIVILVNQPNGRCILMNGGDNISSISSKIRHKVVPVSSENWSLEGYKKIIDDIKNECL